MACSRALSFNLRRSRRLDRGGVPVKLGLYRRALVRKERSDARMPPRRRPDVKCRAHQRYARHQPGACNQHWSSGRSSRRYSRLTRSAPPLSKAAARACSLTSSRPLSQAKIATLEIRRAKNSVPHRSIRNTTPRRTSRFGKPSAVKGRISLPLSFSRSSHASAGRVAPALTFRRRAITAAPAHNLPRLQRRQQTV